MLAQDGKAGLSVTAFLLSKINAHKGSVTIKNNNLRTAGTIYLYLSHRIFLILSIQFLNISYFYFFALEMERKSLH